MNAAAQAVMKELPDLVLAFGNSDEYRYGALFHSRTLCLKLIIAPSTSPRFPAWCILGWWGSMFRDCLADVGHSFVFHKDCALFERRARYRNTPIGATNLSPVAIRPELTWI
jgi:hypothetical protein